MTSMQMNVASKKTDVTLEWVLYINYLLCFLKDITDIRALIDLGSKVNAITLAYEAMLGLKTYHTNIKTQKIDSSTLKTFSIALASFQVQNKLTKPQFFQKPFLLANISAKVMLGMLFLIFNNANI